MIEFLRNQERLSKEEEARIDSRIRTAILVLIAVAAGIIILALVRGKPPGNWYLALILAVLGTVWFTSYVLSAIWKRALAGRTDEQVSAYLRAALLGLCAYAGLGWFLIAMQGNAILGAVIYVLAITGARKQKEIYYKEDTEAGQGIPAGAGSGRQSDLAGNANAYSSQADSAGNAFASSGQADSAGNAFAASGQADPAGNAHPSSGPKRLSMDELPTAANREQREKESGYGSV